MCVLKGLLLLCMSRVNTFMGTLNLDGIVCALAQTAAAAANDQARYVSRALLCGLTCVCTATAMATLCMLWEHSSIVTIWMLLHIGLSLLVAITVAVEEYA